MADFFFWKHFYDILFKYMGIAELLISGLPLIKIDGTDVTIAGILLFPSTHTFIKWFSLLLLRV